MSRAARLLAVALLVLPGGALAQAQAPASAEGKAKKAKKNSKAKKLDAPAAASVDPLQPLVAPPAAPAKAQQAPAPAAAKAPAAAPAARPAQAKATEAKGAPLPPPPAIVKTETETTRVVEAQGDLDPAAADAEAKKDAAKKAITRFRVAPRVGALVPRTPLQTGVYAGAELAYRLPILDDRLRLSLGIGYSQVRARLSRIIIGRGYDPAFLQNTTLMPMELMVTGDVLDEQKGAPLGLSLGVGYGLWWTFTSLHSFDQTVEDRGPAHAFVAALRLLKHLGLGSILVDVRYAEAHRQLSKLGTVAIGDFSGFTFTAGYGFEF
ncbi:MAG TPA: hypothetical protein VGK67_19055 [Myxococcales bacterium]|jgi:hypothetical protein